MGKTKETNEPKKELPQQLDDDGKMTAEKIFAWWELGTSKIKKEIPTSPEKENPDDGAVRVSAKCSGEFRDGPEKENPNQAKLDSEADWLAECMLSNLAYRYREPSKIIAARAAARVLGNGGAVTVLNAHSCFSGETDEPGRKCPSCGEFRDSGQPELPNRAQLDFRDVLEKASDDFLVGLRALHEEYLRQRDREKYFREKAEKWEKQAEAWRRRCYRSGCNTCDAFAEKEELRELLRPAYTAPGERIGEVMRPSWPRIFELVGFPESPEQENVSRETSRREQESALPFEHFATGYISPEGEKEK